MVVMMIMVVVVVVTKMVVILGQQNKIKLNNCDASSQWTWCNIGYVALAKLALTTLTCSRSCPAYSLVKRTFHYHFRFCV